MCQKYIIAVHAFQTLKTVSFAFFSGDAHAFGKDVA
ncbi:MAG: hypothetical protein JWP81_4350 [Ferruginibacter sp.]|nr:hypothetical protein [Ferruginibacter sp.]